MMWFLVSALALIVGIMLYNDLEPHLPEWARLGVKLEQAHPSPDGKNPAGKAGSHYTSSAERWTYAFHDGLHEISRNALSGPNLGGRKGDAPVMFILCRGDKELHFGIDARMKPDGIGAKGNLSAKETVDGSTPAAGQWSYANGNLYRLDPAKLTFRLADAKSYSIRLGFDGTPEQEIGFKVDGLRTALAKFPTSCFK